MPSTVTVLRGRGYNHIVEVIGGSGDPVYSKKVKIIKRLGNRGKSGTNTGRVLNVQPYELVEVEVFLPNDPIWVKCEKTKEWVSAIFVRYRHQRNTGFDIVFKYSRGGSERTVYSNHVRSEDAHTLLTLST